MVPFLGVRSQSKHVGSDWFITLLIDVRGHFVEASRIYDKICEGGFSQSLLPYMDLEQEKVATKKGSPVGCLLIRFVCGFPPA